MSSSGPSTRRAGRGRPAHEARDPVAKGRVRLEAHGDLARDGVRAEHDHVAGADLPPAGRDQERPVPHALEHRDHQLRGEQGEQEQPAHLGGVREEQEAEDHDRDGQDGAQDVQDLPPEGPARPELVQLVKPDDTHPGDAVRQRPCRPRCPGRLPGPRPCLTKAQPGDEDEQRHRHRAVREQQGQPDQAQVVAEHQFSAYLLSAPKSFRDSAATLSILSWSVQTPPVDEVGGWKA